LKRDGGAQASPAHNVQGPRSSVQYPPAQEVSKYRFVTRFVMRGSTYWVGHSGKRRQKLCKSQDEVAAWVAKQRITSPSRLSKGKALYKYRTQYNGGWRW
jgi:hypothetical protein